MVEGKLPANLDALMPDFSKDKPMATRQASGKVLNALAAEVPSLIGGSADLAGSNGTTIAGEKIVSGGDFSGPQPGLRRARARHGRRWPTAWRCTAAFAPTWPRSSCSATTCARPSAWPR